MFSVQELERCTPDPVAAGRMLAATDGEFVLRSAALERENALLAELDFCAVQLKVIVENNKKYGGLPFPAEIAARSTIKAIRDTQGGAQ